MAPYIDQVATSSIIPASPSCPWASQIQVGQTVIPAFDTPCGFMGDLTALLTHSSITGVWLQDGLGDLKNPPYVTMTNAQVPAWQSATVMAAGAASAATGRTIFSGAVLDLYTTSNEPISSSSLVVSLGQLSASAGIGAAWAERRTDLLVDGDVVIQATALWVPIDTSSGRPQRVRPDFKEVYGEAAQGRKVSGRLEAPGAPSSGALRQPWQLRAVDLDVVGHVNNAALWAPLVEVAGSDLAAVTVIHHGPVEAGDEVMLAVDGHRLWLEADGVVAVTANWDESA